MNSRARILVLIFPVVGALVGLVLFLSNKAQRGGEKKIIVSSTNNERAIEPVASQTPTPPPSPSLLPTPLSSPSVAQSPAPSPLVINPSHESTPAPDASVSAQAGSSSSSLIIPVQGVRPEQLQDTFTASRSEGRAHDAIDIPAPQGTPVLAAASGRIIKLFQSERGGTTIYQLDPDNRTIYYYAHLQRYADGINEGHFARQGEVIAYVGDTGNAGAGNYHLHFSIAKVSDPKRWWEGTNINPYPLLRK